jgi:hypothetical protein
MLHVHVHVHVACACACACIDRKLGRPSELWHCALPGLVETVEGDEGATAPPRRSFEVRALVLLEEQLPEARSQRRPCPPTAPYYVPALPQPPLSGCVTPYLGARPLAAAVGQPAAAQQG